MMEWRRWWKDEEVTSCSDVGPESVTGDDGHDDADGDVDAGGNGSESFGGAAVIYGGGR